MCHQPVLLSCFLGRVDLSTIVNLERPRQRNTPEFLKLRGEILDHLHSPVEKPLPLIQVKRRGSAAFDALQASMVG